MAMNGSTWRKHPFIIGNKYIARKDNPDFSLGNIALGQEYLLNYISHSHYDGASIFTFKCLSSDESVSWWWFDNAPEALCLDNFSLIT